MREVVLDTETTGLFPVEGARMVEIGAVELINRVPGKRYRQYIDPDCEIHPRAFAVHGLSEEFLSAYPKFDGIKDEFLEFIGDSTLIAHNAKFDMRFINYQVGYELPNLVVCTLALARESHAKGQCGLDDLAKHYGIAKADRDLHGALTDAELLAKVYVEMIKPAVN